MKPPTHLARVLGEILLIVALVHTLMSLLLPHLGLSTRAQDALWVHTAAVLLLSAPLLYWRLAPVFATTRPQQALPVLNEDAKHAQRKALGLGVLALLVCLVLTAIGVQ